MLKIHKPNHKLFIISITSILSICALLGISYLTYTPELSYAETVTYRKTIKDITYMQEMTPEICKSMELEKQYQLMDIRKNFDGTQPKYWIARLKDNNCWMTQNLDLDIPTEGLKAENTDILNDWNQSTNPIYYPLNTETNEPLNFWADSNPAQGNSITASYDPGNKYCSNNETQLCNLESSKNNGHDSQGNYYTWGAATAGQAGVFDQNTIYPAQSTQSICPKKWRLPTSENSGDFNELVSNLDEDALTNRPYYFVLSGLVYQSYPFIGIGRSGYYWSSIAYDMYTTYNLELNTKISPSNRYNYGRYAGMPIRCVARSESILNNNIKVIINNSISLDAANEVIVEKTNTNPSTVNLDVKVSSNQKYSVGISATDPNLISLTNNTTIPAKSGLLNTAENGWGIKLKDDTNYTALTTSLQTFYTASGAEIKTIPFIIGISTAPDIPNGEYSTDITVTATQN